MREFVLTPVTRLRGLFMAVMMIAVCAMQTVSATDDGAGTQSLAAIRTVALQISGVNKDWARRGFDQTQLYAEVETHLQAAGFKVISPAALKDYPDAALLSLELHVNNTLVNWSYLVFLKLKVKVPVPVNPEGFVTRTVWSDWKIGGVELDYPGRLREPIFSLLTEFEYRRLPRSGRRQ